MSGVIPYKSRTEAGRHQEDRGLKRLVRMTIQPDLLILDERGYVTFDLEGSQLLFQVVADRCKTKA